MKMNNKVYDALKWVSLVALDAFGIAYQNLAEIWNLPFGIEIRNTFQVISVLIGALIGVAGYVYNKGDE